MPRKKTQIEVIQKFENIHGNKYDYSNVKYVNSKRKVEIICKQHGLFSITPNHHSKGVGCRKCYYDSQKLSKDQFIKRSIEYWGLAYDYSHFSTMPKTGVKVKIQCKLHNIIFYQEPRNHMNGHSGCHRCKSLKLSGSGINIGKIKTQEELNEDFQTRAIIVHGDLYDYTKFVYLSASKKGIIICTIHGVFIQSPSNHLRGSKCPKCSIEQKKSNTLKKKCKDLGVNYHRALKRQQAGMSEEMIFSNDYLRSVRAINEIQVYGVLYPNLEEAIRKLSPIASSRTISRRIKGGMPTEEAFEKIPNPGYANGIIYVIKNSINNKLYVGLTVQKIERRWEFHVEQAYRKSIKNSDSLHAAIRKFGKEVFTIEPIDNGTTKIDLEQKEIKWIKEFDCIAPKGYNISSGGVSGGSNKKPTLVDNIQFESVKQAVEYISESRNVSIMAAKKRLENGRIDAKKPAVKGKSEIKTKLYKTWSRIIHSATNPKSKDYIPNISVKQEWKNYDKFKVDVGQPPEKSMVFSRMDKMKGFYPDNCEWMSRSKAGKINISFMKESGKFNLNSRKKRKDNNG